MKKVTSLILLLNIACAAKAPLSATREKHFTDTWAGGFSTHMVGSPTFTSDGKNLYFGTSNGTLYALSGKNGSVLFKKTFSGAIEATPLITDSAILVGTSKGELTSIDKLTHKVQWSVQFNGEVVGKPFQVEDMILAGTNDGFLYALDPKTGEQKWRFKKEPPDRITLKGFPSPIVKHDNVLVAFADGSVSSLRKSDGAETWSMKLPSTSRFGDVISPLVSLSDEFLVAQYGGATFGLDEGGIIRWSQPASGSGGNISVEGDTAYLPGNENQVKAVNVKTGQPVWTTVLPETATFSGSAIYRNSIVLGSFEGRLFQLNKSTGKVEWTYDLGAPIQGPPQVTQGKLWVLTEKGKLFRFE